MDTYLLRFHIIFSVITGVIFFYPLSSLYGQLSNEMQIDCLKEQIQQTDVNHYDSSFRMIEKGIRLSIEENDSINLGIFYRYKGLLLRHNSKKLSLYNFFKAKQIFEDIGYDRARGVCYIHLSDISTDPKEKLKLALQAKDLAYAICDTQLIAHALNCLGATISDKSNKDTKDSALCCYETALKFALKTGDSTIAASIYNNIGTIQKWDSRDYNNAFVNFHRSVRMSKNIDDILGSQANLMSLHLDLNNLDSALFYYEKLKGHFKRRPELALVYYNNFAAYYQYIDKAKGFDYLATADSMKVALAKERDASALGLLEMEYESQLKEKQVALLNAEIEKAEYLKYFLISIALIILLTGGVSFYQYKQRSQKKRETLIHKKRRAEAEKRLMAEKLHNAELKSQYLNNQLKYTSNELAYVATGNVQNRKLLSELKVYLEKTYRKKDLGGIKDNLRELNIQLVQLINKDRDEQQKIIEKAEDVNMSIIYGLKEKFPDLTENDTKLLMLLLLKFNSKEIASMYNIEERSAMIRRYRLRKKLNMKKREAFEDFFERILPEIPIFNSENE